MLTSLKGLLNVGKSAAQESPEAHLGVNVNAGAEVLAHFQQEWAELHEINENNAAKAEKLATEITRLEAVVNKEHESSSHLVQLLTSTPTLKNGVENCLVKITDLYESFDKVEIALFELENLIEEVELKQKKFDNRYQFTLYKEKKLANLETARQKLAAAHAQKILEHDLKQRQVLQERQQVFQEAFHYDLEAYKSSGELPKEFSDMVQPVQLKTVDSGSFQVNLIINSLLKYYITRLKISEIEVPKAQSSALLEEIQLDLDKKELDQFLEGT